MFFIIDYELEEILDFICFSFFLLVRRMMVKLKSEFFFSLQMKKLILKGLVGLRLYYLLRVERELE